MAAHRAYYSVIQYCPDLGRLEAANVGVVLFCPELHFLDARTSRANERIIHFFGREGHDWKQINAFKKGIAERVRLSVTDIRDKESFGRFISMQANLMQLTPPLPCRVSSDPKSELDHLFEQIVGVEKRRVTTKSLRRLLGQKFEKGGISDKVRQDISVTVPVLNKRVEIPYGFQNGRFNLITPAKFEAKDTDSVVATACRYAVEGRSLFDNPDQQLGDMQLVVVGKFRAKAPEARKAVDRVLSEHEVKLVRFDRIPDLVDEIRRTGKILS